MHIDMPYPRKQARKEKTNHLSSLLSRKLVFFLSLLLILLTLPVTIFLVNYQQIFTGHASSTDSVRAEAESASLSGPVTTGYGANASGTSTSANYLQFGTGTTVSPTPTSTPANYGNILWRGDFETGDLSQWAGIHTGSAWLSDSSINVVTSPVRQGKYAAQFTDNTNPYGNSFDRAELSSTQATTGGYNGQDWYYSWSTYLPSNPNLKTGWADWTNLMQWMDLYHQCSPPAVVLIMPGYRNNPPSANPFFTFVDQPMDNQNGCATLGPKHQFYLGDVVYDQWVDFTMHIKWSADPTIGYVELWKNGKQLIAKQNMRTLDTSGGVYQEAQLYRGNNWTGTNVVYHDNVIRHDAYSPGTTGAATATPSPTTACTTPLPSGTGMATTTITIPSIGTYALWTRMMVPSSSANSYYLQVDSGCPYLVSDTIGTNSWDWVMSAPITLALTTGSHTITMVGNQTGVKVDELIFSQSCTPTGTGDSCFSTETPTPQPQATYPSGIKNVFMIVMENQDWSSIKGNTLSAPYINSLLARSDASYASNYHNVAPPETTNGYLHPSEPNYIWLEAGTNSFADHTFTTDNDATSGNYTTSTSHLSTLLQNKGLSWRAYQESMPTGCPITSSGNYAAKHNPFVFFTDVSGNPPSTTNTNCSSHIVPFTQLVTDVQNNTLPSYSYITPNLCDDMHDNSCTGANDPIHQGDTWLSNNLPTILNSQAYKNGGAVFITWDEDSGSTTNNPIGMIVLSPLAKGNGYTNTTLYSHSSFVRTVETIFGLSPLLANAPSATDLSDLFVTSSGLTPTPTPSPSPTDTPPAAFWAWDTFQRPDQTYWGTASNGMTWGGNADSSSSFSISNNTGLIEPSSAENFNAVLGLPVANAEVFMSGSMTALAGGVNTLGVVLRWSNQSNYYRAAITGSKLVIQRVVNGSFTTLKSTSFTASPNTSYTIRFNANGTALSAKAWQPGTTEPADWMVTATDSTFASGQCGIRTHQQTGTITTITSFWATQL